MADMAGSAMFESACADAGAEPALTEEGTAEPQSAPEPQRDVPAEPVVIEQSSQFRIAQRHNKNQWRPANKPMADATRSHYYRSLTPFEKETKALVESVIGQPMRTSLDGELLLVRNGAFIRKNLAALRKIASLIPNEHDRRSFFTHGFRGAMDLAQRFGMQPIIEIVRTNPERAWALLVDLGEMSQLVSRIGIRPFVHIAQRYKNAEQILDGIQGTSLGHPDGSCTYLHTLRHEIKSAPDLLYYAEQISQYVDAVSKLDFHGSVHVGYLVNKYGIENIASIGRIAKAPGNKSLHWRGRRLDVEQELTDYKHIIDDYGIPFFADLYELGNGSVAFGLKENWENIRKIFPTPEAVLAVARDIMAMIEPEFERTRHWYEENKDTLAIEMIQADYCMIGRTLVENILNIQPLIARFGLAPLVDIFVNEKKSLSSDDFESLAALTHIVTDSQDIPLVCDAMQGLSSEAHACLRALRQIVRTHDDLGRLGATLMSLNTDIAKAIPSLAHLIQSFDDLDAAISLLNSHTNGHTEKDTVRMAIIRNVALKHLPHLLETIDDVDATTSRIHAYARELQSVAFPNEKHGGDIFMQFLHANLKSLVPHIKGLQDLEDICRSYVDRACRSPQFIEAIAKVFPHVAHLVKNIEDFDTLCAKVCAQLNDTSMVVYIPLKNVGHDITTFDLLDEYYNLVRDIAQACPCETSETRAVFEVVAAHCSTIRDMQQWRDVAKKMERPVEETVFLRRMKDVLDVRHLDQGLQLYRAVQKDVGIMPARRESAFDLLREGLARLKESGEESKDIPAYFLLQTLAVSRDERQFAAIRKLLGSKKLRGSRDERKAVMWFLEDHRHERQHMEQFYRLIELSSAGDAMVKNLRALVALLLVDPDFNLEGVRDQKEFQDKAQASLLSFISQKSKDGKVQARFMEKVMEFHQNGLLQAVVNMYARYTSYPEMAGLLDIALAAIVMGDFAKVKFLTPEAIAGMEYLSPEQRGQLLSAIHQLDLLSPEQRDVWQQDLSRTREVDDARDTVEQARADVRQRIADLKFHFQQHFQTRANEIEQTITFAEGDLAQIEAMRSKAPKDSAEADRLGQLAKIVAGVRNLEGLNFDQIKEQEVRVGEQLQALIQATKTLFRQHYGWNEQQIASLQAKMDIELLKGLMLGKLERLQIKSLRAYESSDPIHLMLAGNEPKNSGSCQRYDGEPSLMIGLSGYLLNASEKVVRIKNQDNIVVGRSILRVVEADGRPALFLERAYYRNAQSDAAIDAAIIELSMEKARQMGMPLITRWRETENKATMKIVTRAGLSPYTYSDGIVGNNGVGGVLRGAAVAQDLKVSVLHPDSISRKADITSGARRSSEHSAELFMPAAS